MLTAGALAADSPLPPLLDEGTRALDEGLPQVAAYKLRAFLQSSPAPPLRRAAVLALVRALLAVPDAPAALALLDAEVPISMPPVPADDPLATFWRGQTLAALGRWPEALAAYDHVADASAKDATLAAQARFGRGESLLALDRVPEAEAAFRPLRNHPQLGPLARLRYAEIALDSRHLKKDATTLLDEPAPAASGNLLTTQEHAYLVGRLRLAQRQPALAQQIFSAALFGPGMTPHPRGLSENLLVDNYWGLARAYLDEDQLDSARSTLENLIEHYPRPSVLEPTFPWLESLYLRGPTHDLTDLNRWVADEEKPERAALASLTLGRVQAHAGDTEQAEEIFAGFGERFPESALRARALLDLAGLRLQLGHLDAAREALQHARLLAGDEPTWRTGIEVLDARISLAGNEPAKAAERFGDVAARLGPGPQAEAAAFNAVLAWLQAMDTDRFNAARTDFEARFPKSPLRAEFPLEEGLARADQTPPMDLPGRQQAADCLRRFLDEHPTHPRAGEARLALAELAFERPRADVKLALRELGPSSSLQQVANDGGSNDRAEYLAVWLADAPGPTRDADKAIALAKRFLEQRPDSPLVGDVRMKLGEMYFQSGDYPDAQTQLELVARKSPAAPLAEAALYLAGRAASLSMSTAGLNRAVELFDEAARRGGLLRLSASLRLAELMQTRLNDGTDALTLYDNVLKATDSPALSDADLEARCAAILGKGQTLLALAVDDPKRIPDALAAFEKLATGTPGASLAWRRQALILKGDTLEKSGDSDAALSAYDDAMNAAEPPPGEALTPEWTWFYRAGNKAALLLESHAKWSAAIAVYKKLAAADGPMKAEYENLGARRRLEHFVWDE